MPHPALSVTLLLSATPMLAATDAPVRVAQLTIHQRVVIRVPRMPQDPMPVQARSVKPISWKEKKGPKCLPAQGMAGALITASRQVDLVLVGGKRYRAKLNRDCKPLDFYSGFYVRPSKDGMICSDRDAIRVRSGAACEIDEFKVLQAAK
jgi:hypothetical protein